MAEIQAGTDFGFRSAADAYKTGIDTQNYREQRQAQTSLLSSQAEEQKNLIEEKKQVQATNLATKAALNKAQLNSLDVDSTSIDGQLTILDKARKATTNDVEIQDSLAARQRDLLAQKALASTQRSKLLGEQSEEAARVVNQALLNPEVGAASVRALGESTGNNQLIQLARGLSGEIPVPPQFTDGKVLYFNQLNPAQRETVTQATRLAFPGGKIETTAHNIQTELNARARREEIERNNKEQTRLREQDVANKRERGEASAAAAAKEKGLKREGLILKYKQELGDTMKDLNTLIKEQPTIDNPDYKDEWGFDSQPETIPNPEIENMRTLVKEIKGNIASLEKDSLLEVIGEPAPGEGVIKKQDKSTTSDGGNEVIIQDTLKENPGASREEVIASLTAAGVLGQEKQAVPSPMKKEKTEEELLNQWLNSPKKASSTTSTDKDINQTTHSNTYTSSSSPIEQMKIDKEKESKRRKKEEKKKKLEEATKAYYRTMDATALTDIENSFGRAVTKTDQVLFSSWRNLVSSGLLSGTEYAKRVRDRMTGQDIRDKKRRER